MPVSGIGSWLPTIDEFAQHWDNVNEELVGGAGAPLTLLGGYTRAMFIADRAELNTALGDVQAADNVRQNAAGDRDVKRASLRPRFLQFGTVTRGRLPRTLYLRSIPRTPGFNDSPGIWRDRIDDMNSLWTTINANVPAVPGFTPPLLLAGDYPLATYTTESTALSNAFTTLANADQAAQLTRERRDDLFDPIYQHMVQYRAIIPGIFPPGHALIESLPRLSPIAGSTPQAVNLSGSWITVDVTGRLVWSASTAPDLDHYEIRYHPGPRYRAAEEQFVDNVPAGTLTFDTNFGLAASGSSAWYKVYVVTTTLNEKGSNAVKIVRP